MSCGNGKKTLPSRETFRTPATGLSRVNGPAVPCLARVIVRPGGKSKGSCIKLHGGQIPVAWRTGEKPHQQPAAFLAARRGYGLASSGTNSLYQLVYLNIVRVHQPLHLGERLRFLIPGIQVLEVDHGGFQKLIFIDGEIRRESHLQFPSSRKVLPSQI